MGGSVSMQTVVSAVRFVGMMKIHHLEVPEKNPGMA